MKECSKRFFVFVSIVLMMCSFTGCGKMNSRPQINLPSTPISISDRFWSNFILNATISDLSYKTSRSSTIINMTVSLDENISKYSSYTPEAERVRIGYALKDSDGVIISRRWFYTEPLEVGERTEESLTFNNLDPDKIYTFTIET